MQLEKMDDGVVEGGKSSDTRRHVVEGVADAVCSLAG